MSSSGPSRDQCCIGHERIPRIPSNATQLWPSHPYQPLAQIALFTYLNEWTGQIGNNGEAATDVLGGQCAIFSFRKPCSRLPLQLRMRRFSKCLLFDMKKKSYERWSMTPLVLGLEMALNDNWTRGCYSAGDWCAKLFSSPPRQSFFRISGPCPFSRFGPGPIKWPSELLRVNLLPTQQF